MKFSLDRFFWVLYAGVILYAFYSYNPFLLFFQNDDFIHIPLSSEGVLFQRNSFRPVCDLSVMLDEHLFGKNATGYHITNLVLHVICCLLVFLVSKKTFGKYYHGIPACKTAVMVALLFFAYAMHSEAVLWILGRSAIIGLIFSLLFTLSYLARKQTVYSIARYVLFLFLSLLSYESSFILPVLAALLFLIEGIKKERIHVGIVFISFFIYLLLRFYVTGEIYGSYEVANIGGSGLIIVIQNYAKLLMRSFIPAYSQGFLVVILFLIIAVTAVVLLLKSRKSKPMIVLSMVFLLSLLPYVSLGIAAHGYEGERYLYFPVFFVCLLIVGLISQSFKNELHRNFIFLLILLIHSVSLNLSSKNFRIAGNVNRIIIQAVNALPAGTDTLFVQQLPQAQNGALVMRDGFKEAVSWLGNNDSMKVVVLSKRNEWLPLKEGYKSVYTNSLMNDDEKVSRLSTTSPVFHFSDTVLFIKK